MVSQLSVFAIGLNIQFHFFIYSDLRKTSICSEQQSFLAVAVSIPLFRLLEE